MEMHVNDISTKTTLCCYTIANGSFRDVVFIITTINIMSRKQKLDSIIFKKCLMYALQSFQVQKSVVIIEENVELCVL